MYCNGTCMQVTLQTAAFPTVVNFIGEQEVIHPLFLEQANLYHNIPAPGLSTF